MKLQAIEDKEETNNYKIINQEMEINKQQFRSGRVQTDCKKKREKVLDRVDAGLIPDRQQLHQGKRDKLNDKLQANR